MKKIFLIFFYSFSLASCAQTDKKNIYNENLYTEKSRGAYESYSYVVISQFKNDSSYTIAKYYLDSNYVYLMTKFYLHNRILDGPFFGYVNNKIVEKGFYKNGKRDGEFIELKDGKEISKKYFSNGEHIKSRDQ